jgi:ethanolamine permease
MPAANSPWFYDSSYLLLQTSYTPADADYMAKRRLRRHARAWHLWAMGVGAVISGDFFGWNYGLATGGFGGMLLAVLVMTVMYLGLCFSIAEMSAALPHAGGAYSFARTAMGPMGGYITGLAENMEYILTPAVIVVGVGQYLGSIFGTPASWEPAWWLVCYGIFVALNIWGVEMTFHVSVIVTLIALAVLVVFWIGAAPHFDLARWASPYFRRAAAAFFRRSFEFLSRSGSTSESSNCRWPRKRATTPSATCRAASFPALLTLIAVSFLTVVLSCGIAPGTAKVATSDQPLFLGFQTIFGLGLKTRALALVGRSHPPHRRHPRRRSLRAHRSLTVGDSATGCSPTKPPVTASPLSRPASRRKWPPPSASSCACRT